jgi:glutaminyl-tRNA synthetase
MPETTETPRHFLQQIIDADNASGKWGGRVHTRFPPEPNGFLHIGHAKAICLNFGLAEEFGGKCNLRFDDTNPAKEEQRYIDAIIEDIRWLGFDWEDRLFYASDYFETMYELARDLISRGKAFVCDLNAEEMRAYRGTAKEPGRNSPYRDRDPKESLDLFQRMRMGEFADGSRTLRARIDMASPNFNLRDPVMYRIVRATHPRVGDAWSIYPTYDWAHGLEDSIEGITHSICTLEFEDHRPLYDWFLDAINEGRPADDQIVHPQQIEFAKFRPSFTVLSKRNLRRLVEEGRVSGWDDPRMPTLSGMRRRGYTPESIRSAVMDVGVTKFNSVIDFGRIENAARDHLNATAERRMAVLDPLRVVIDNYPEGEVEQMEVINNPEDEAAGTRHVPFTREIYIERSDFMEDPPKKFFRLGPGREVRLRCAYWITCTDVIKNDEGNIVELRATYDPQTKGGESPPPDDEGKVRKVKGTLHWVSAAHAIDAEVRVYDRLFEVEAPDRKPKDAPDDWDWIVNLNEDSLHTVTSAKLEPSLAGAAPGDRYQFERLGYFCVDVNSTADAIVFNRTVTLKDSWSKIAQKG